MSLNYSVIWEKLNNLEQNTIRIDSLKQILDCILEYLDEGDLEKVEALTNVSRDYVDMFLDSFKNDFSEVWGETITKIRNEGIKEILEEIEEIEKVAEEENNSVDKIQKWVIPVEFDAHGEYYIQLPDDLLEAAGLESGDSVEWVDLNNGTWQFKKVSRTYDEMVTSGYEMTDDGFWIPKS